MRILFIQPRYHTNRHPMVKALINYGHEVKYISLYANDTETYEIVEPEIIGFSKLVDYLISNSDIKNRLKYGWPPLRQLWTEMKSFNPDVVIVRNYTVTSAISLLYANLIQSNGALQEQWPEYVDSISWKKKLIHSTYKKIFNKPFIRITPIKGDERNAETLPDVYYLPFTVDLEKYKDFRNKVHFDDGYINIISVGKLRSKRKNHIMLLKSIKKLDREHDLRLTIVGSLKDESNDNYLSILNYIDDNELHNIVNIKTNMDYNKLQQEYAKHDLYVLPSESEPAAVSPLEAMAAGLPAICSDSNGTKGYIVEGETGYVFRTGSQTDLTQKIEHAICDREQLKQMGENAWHNVREDHHPEKYAKSFEQIIENSFDLPTFK